MHDFFFCRARVYYYIFHISKDQLRQINNKMKTKQYAENWKKKSNKPYHIKRNKMAIKGNRKAREEGNERKRLSVVCLKEGDEYTTLSAFSSIS